MRDFEGNQKKKRQIHLVFKLWSCACICIAVPHGKPAHWGSFQAEDALIIPNAQQQHSYSVFFVSVIQSSYWLVFGTHIDAASSNRLDSLILK